MNDKSRLGRGLEDVSRFYLSDSPREEGEREPAGDEPVRKDPVGREPVRKEPVRDLTRQRRVIRVVSPGSALMGSFFTANFSLELARHRLRVAVFDSACPGNEEGGVEAMLREVVHPDPASEVSRVRLYGLHDIPVHPVGDESEAGFMEQIREAAGPGGDQWAVINTPYCLDALAKSPVDFDTVLLSTLNEACLLQCYAAIKIIVQRDPQAGISLAFIDPGSEEQVRGVFSRFSSFAGERLGSSVGCLGHILRDDALESSISGHRPLVLGFEPSPARESLAAVSRAFLEQHRIMPDSGGGGLQ